MGVFQLISVSVSRRRKCSKHKSLADMDTEGDNSDGDNSGGDNSGDGNSGGGNSDSDGSYRDIDSEQEQEEEQDSVEGGWEEEAGQAEDDPGPACEPVHGEVDTGQAEQYALFKVRTVLQYSSAVVVAV